MELVTGTGRPVRDTASGPPFVGCSGREIRKRCCMGSLLRWALVVALATFALTPARGDRVDSYVRAQMQKGHIPGVSVAVVRGGRMVLARGYGLANVECAAPATRDTVYELLSVTKQFTATAILMLAQEGRLSL